MKQLFFLCFVLFLMPVSALAQMVPHKALYDVKLISTRNGAMINDIQGQMFYEWTKNCDAWVTDHRSSLTYLYTDGNHARITTDFITYEALDGNSLNFTSKRAKNGEIYEEYRGFVDLNDDEPTPVTYQQPDYLDPIILPQGTFFPMNHTNTLLKQAKDGKNPFFQAVLFDGADDTGPQDVNIFIGKARQAPMPEGIDDKELMGRKAWPLRLAFFPLSDQDNPTGRADYEMDLIAHDTGVVSDIMIEYPDFKVHQVLRAVEPIDPPKCR